MRNIDEPSRWIEIAKDAISCYNQYFDTKKNKWNEVTFPLFMINCSIIYLIKFFDELYVIGSLDAGNRIRRLFINLVLREAESYDSSAISENENAEFFDSYNRVESSLKCIAELINDFGQTSSDNILKSIAYNVYDEPMIIDFEEEYHDSISRAVDLGYKIVATWAYIDPLIKNE